MVEAGPLPAGAPWDGGAPPARGVVITRGRLVHLRTFTREDLPCLSRWAEDPYLVRMAGSELLQVYKDVYEGDPSFHEAILTDTDFSRQHDFSPETADLNLVLGRTVAMVKRQRGLKHVSVEEKYAAGLPLVEVDVSRMQQVFLNIINNALYAMPDTGALTIRTSAADGVVAVDFADTGTGIAPEHLDRIFDPFFTTKPEVAGTGLGLSVSLGIVQSHGGSIEVQSAPGRGSTFTIKLPARAHPPGGGMVP